MSVYSSKLYLDSLSLFIKPSGVKGITKETLSLIPSQKMAVNRPPLPACFFFNFSVPGLSNLVSHQL